MPTSVQPRPASAPPFRRSQAYVFAAALAALGGLALWQQLQIYQLTHGPAHIRDADRQVSVRRVAGSRLALTPRLTTHLPKSGAAARRDSDSGPDAAMGSWKPTGSLGNGSVLADGDFVNAYELYREGMLDLRYADLFRRLDLTPDELSAFKRLLAQKDSLALDVVAVSQAIEAPPSAGLVPPQVRSAQSEIEQSIKSTLGDDRYDTYRDYESTMAQRATVAQLERRLSYSASPLSPAQSDGLVKVLASSAPRDSGSTVPSISFVVGGDVSGVMPVVNPDAAGLITDEAIAGARNLLTPLQISALMELQVEQRAALDAGRLITEGSATTMNPPLQWGLLLQ
ncbi:MAG TPA: hypothetical protein VHD32_11630 [Candidatus Didemnitutus sp.]|nr:hypothetical protein [Candidatus Didemnitutus sp.]